MDKELNLLRRVARAARIYQDKVIQERSVQLGREGHERDEGVYAMLDIRSAEFELSEALNEWYCTLLKSS